MKNGKAAGEEGIAAEVYKAGGNEMIRWLTQTEDEQEETPDEW